MFDQSAANRRRMRRQYPLQGPEMAMRFSGALTAEVRKLARAALREKSCFCGRSAFVVQFDNGDLSQPPQVWCEDHEPNARQAQRDRSETQLNEVAREIRNAKKAERARAYVQLTRRR
jgi:hypothetical protein